MTKAQEYWKTQGKNFMTNQVIEYIDTPRYLVELSQGRGFHDNDIFGVSVATQDGERDHDLSHMYGSEQDARAYIESELI